MAPVLYLRGVLWRAMQRHNAGGLELLDAIRVEAGYRSDASHWENRIEYIP